jgi:hypothetical protein
MAITPLPTPPARSMTSEAFVTAADAFLGALPVFQSELNATAAALDLNSTTDSSSSSVLIGLGTKTFVVTAGKSFLPGMYLVFADTTAPATNSMVVQVTTYSGTSLVVSSKSSRGSGTIGTWQISLSAAPADIAADIAAATGKTTPVDTDKFGMWDTVSTLLRSTTWANIKTTMEAYLSGLTTTWAISTSGRAATVTTNANLTGGVTSVGNAATVVTNANLTGGVTSVGNAATVVTNANLTGGVTSVGNAATVVTNANLTGHVTSTGNATILGSFTKAQLNTAISDGDAVYANDTPALVGTNFTGTAAGLSIGGNATTATTATTASGVISIPNRTDTAYYQTCWNNKAGGDNTIYSSANVTIRSSDGSIKAGPIFDGNQRVYSGTNPSTRYTSGPLGGSASVQFSLSVNSESGLGPKKVALSFSGLTASGVDTSYRIRLNGVTSGYFSVWEIIGVANETATNGFNMLCGTGFTWHGMMILEKNTFDGTWQMNGTKVTSTGTLYIDRYVGKSPDVGELSSITITTLAGSVALSGNVGISYTY